MPAQLDSEALCDDRDLPCCDTAVTMRAAYREVSAGDATYTDVPELERWSSN